MVVCVGLNANPSGRLPRLRGAITPSVGLNTGVVVGTAVSMGDNPGPSRGVLVSCSVGGCAVRVPGTMGGVGTRKTGVFTVVISEGEPDVTTGAGVFTAVPEGILATVVRVDATSGLAVTVDVVGAGDVVGLATLDPATAWNIPNNSRTAWPCDSCCRNVPVP